MNNNYNKRNISIQFLRFILCFLIVFGHLSIVRNKYEKYLYMRYHVPTFIFLAFYFYYPILACRNINKIISRFQRLLIPYIIWPSLIFILHNISSKAFKLKRFEGKLPIKYLYLQILIGII